MPLGIRRRLGDEIARNASGNQLDVIRRAGRRHAARPVQADLGPGNGLAGQVRHPSDDTPESAGPGHGHDGTRRVERDVGEETVGMAVPVDGNVLGNLPATGEGYTHDVPAIIQVTLVRSGNDVEVGVGTVLV